MKLKPICSLLLIALISACGGGGSSSAPPPANNPQPEPDLAPAPQNVKVSVESANMVLGWDSVEGATDYSVYYSTEKGIEPINYASYEGGTWIQNTTPPVSIPISDMSAVYHFIVSANVDSVEGEHSLPVIAVPRYVASATPGWVLDRTNNFEWSRCPYGQTYNAAEHSCNGTASRIGLSEAIAAANSEDAEVPTEAFISTIVFCSEGEPAYFPVGTGCTFSSLEPAVYEPAFPHSVTETESFITFTYCSVNTLRIYSFGGGYPDVCAGPPDALGVNLRMLKRP